MRLNERGPSASLGLATLGPRWPAFGFPRSGAPLVAVRSVVLGKEDCDVAVQVAVRGDQLHECRRTDRLELAGDYLVVAADLVVDRGRDLRHKGLGVGEDELRSEQRLSLDRRVAHVLGVGDRLAWKA